MSKKYEFTGETKVEYGITLRRIRLLIDLPGFEKGSIGGWIEKESNLSHEGNCWVFGNSLVFENSRVSENSRVFGNSFVFGDSQVFGNSWVFENSQVFENSRVFGDSQVSGNSLVYGNSRVSGNSRVYGNAIIQHKFSGGVCVNVTTDPWNISYSGFEEVEGKKVHYVSVGCQDHAIENWLNPNYRQEIISKHNFPEKKVQEFLHSLNLICENVGYVVEKVSIKDISTISIQDRINNLKNELNLLEDQLKKNDLPIVGEMYNVGVCFESNLEESSFYTNSGRKSYSNPIKDLVHLNTEEDRKNAKILMSFFEK